MKKSYLLILIMLTTFSILFLVFLTLALVAELVNPEQNQFLVFFPFFCFIVFAGVLSFFAYYIGKDDGAGPLADIYYVEDGAAFQVTSQFPVHIADGRVDKKVQGYLLRDLKNEEERECAFCIHISQCVGERFFSPGDTIRKCDNKWKKVELSESQ